MSIEGVLALLNDERPAAWLQYADGSWAPVAEDGWVGPPITAEDLLAVAQQGSGLRRLSSRAFDLSQESQDLLTSMAERLRESEGLPEIPPDDVDEGQ
ncbi:hypothetical protein VMT65_11320 [Nocardia sp. CDC153]|nr:hypothetical protein [Nocardia sp. CDC153]MEC3953623.1 hypothetical protein [Nocardia sp. CDC153]